ncbi:LOW QUALITY PROTEIN: hypothetical protein CRUP_033727, partial [Coryphaenoides rupestris]
NSIRHNLSLHTRFIRVQNEGTGKSSWWMLNPEGGKMGKGPRRRAAAVDGCGKYLKTKGRIGRKRAGAMGLGRPHGQVQVQGPLPGQGLQGSPEHGSPAGKGGLGMGGEEYDPAWTEIHSRTSSSASTMSGCLSPILAEAEADEPEEGGLSCSAASPRLYPSPGSTRSPALGAGSHCLPQLTDLTGAISLDESGYPRPPHLKCGGYPYVPGPKAGEGSYYGQPAMGMLQLHSPMETIQENKPVSFRRPPLRGYSENNALQSLLTGIPQYCGKELPLAPGREGHALMPQGSNGIQSQQSHNQSRCHNHTQNRNQSQEHAAHNSPSMSNGHGSVHDQNAGNHQNHNQAHKHHGNLDYSHGPPAAKSQAAHSDYGPSLEQHGHGNKLNSSPDSRLPRLGQTHAHHTHNPHADLLHSGPHPQALSPRGNAGATASDGLPVQQPYSLKQGSGQYGARAHLPTPTCLPPNPAAVVDVPQDPCRLASAPHPRWSAVSDPWHSSGYYHHPHHQPHGGHQLHHHHHHHHHQGHQAGLGYPAAAHHHHQQQHSHGGLELEAGANNNNGLDCDVDSILLSDFMESTESVDFGGFDGSLSHGVGMGMGMSLGAFACPPSAHSNQSWITRSHCARYLPSPASDAISPPASRGYSEVYHTPDNKMADDHCAPEEDGGQSKKKDSTRLHLHHNPAGTLSLHPAVTRPPGSAALLTRHYFKSDGDGFGIVVATDEGLHVAAEHGQAQLQDGVDAVKKQSTTLTALSMGSTLTNSVRNQDSDTDEKKLRSVMCSTSWGRCSRISSSNTA